MDDSARVSRSRITYPLKYASGSKVAHIAGFRWMLLTPVESTGLTST